MTPPNSLIGTLTSLRPLQRFRWRAAIFAPLVVILVLLGFFPERYQATSSFAPSDSASMGLSGAFAGLGSIANVFGNQAAIEVAQRVAKSVAVRDRVIAETHLADRLPGSDRVTLQRWLGRHVDVRSMRGGIIVVEMQYSDPVLAREIVSSYVHSTQVELTVISRRQTNSKRELLRQLVSDAYTEFSQAQAKYDAFRLRNGYAEPRQSIAAIGDRIPMLEAEIKGRQVALSVARRLYTDENLTVKQQLAEVAALQGQLATAKDATSKGADSLGKIVDHSNQLFYLERELGISRALYDSYMRYLQGTAVEDLTAASNVRVLEQAYIETARQYYLPALVGALACLMLWMAIEFYRLRPPVGNRLEFRQTDD